MCQPHGKELKTGNVKKYKAKLEERVTGKKSTMFSTTQSLFITAACGLLTFEYPWIRFPSGSIVKAKIMSYADQASPAKAVWTLG